MRYYNIKMHCITDFIDDEITIVETDDRVSDWFKPLELNEVMTYTSEGFPLRITYQTKEDGSRYEAYNDDGTPNIDKCNEIIESNRINLIKAKAGQLIEAKYPTYKQLNIIRNGGDELVAMGTYINAIRVISDQAEVDGTAFEDIDWDIVNHETQSEI
jgi:hypothetical protein